MELLEKLRQVKGTNAKEILEGETGFQYDSDVEIKVLFETEKTKYIVVPARKALDEKEVIKMGKGPCTTTSPNTHTSHC